MKKTFLVFSIFLSFIISAQPNFTSPTSSCEGSSLLISANNGSFAVTGYTWSTFPAGPLINTPNGQNTLIQFPVADTYTITLETEDAQNNYSHSQTIVVNPLPQVAIGIFQPLPICPPPTQIGGLNMSGTGAVTYTWQPGNMNGNNVSIFPQPAFDITYTLFGTDANGCTASVSQFIPVYPLPQLFATATTSACIGNTICLSASGSLDTYVWSGPCGYSSQNQNDCFPAVLGCSGTYTVGGAEFSTQCINEMTVAVTTIAAQPTINVSTTTPTLCAGQSATLSASGASSYTWAPGGIGNSIVISPTVTTNYTVTGSGSQGCTSNQSFQQIVTVCTLLTDQTINNSVQAFPNPAASKLYIITEAKNPLLIIYDLAGSEVLRKNLNEHAIDLTKLQQGIYFVHVFENEKTLKRIRLIKE